MRSRPCRAGVRAAKSCPIRRTLPLLGASSPPSRCNSGREEPALAAKNEREGVGQILYAAGGQKGGADEKVAVAAHEVHGAAGDGGAQCGGALGFKAGLAGGVVAYPGFKQVAQNEDGAGCRAQHVALPGGHGGRFSRVQVQIGNEVHGLPRGRGRELRDGGGRGEGVRHGWRRGGHEKAGRLRGVYQPDGPQAPVESAQAAMVFIVA